MATVGTLVPATSRLSEEQQARAEALRIAKPLVTGGPFGSPSPENLIRVAEWILHGRRR